MNRSIVVLTAVMTLSHALLGCCAHAVHGAGCRDEAHADSGDHHRHEVSQAGGQHGRGDQRAPDHDDECCRSKCSCKWISPDTSGSLSVDLLGYTAIFDEDQSRIRRGLRTLPSTYSPAEFPIALPVRSHLALGVLLI